MVSGVLVRMKEGVMMTKVTRRRGQKLTEGAGKADGRNCGRERRKVVKEKRDRRMAWKGRKRGTERENRRK
jgi:hypothetical protein